MRFLSRLRTQVFIMLCICFMSSSAWAWRLEVGTVSLPATSSGNFTQVSFTDAHELLPLVFVLGTADDAPAAVRIKNVTASGFQLAQLEPDLEDGTHQAMAVHYLAIEPGVHFMDIDGVSIEVSAESVDLYSSTTQGPTSALQTGWGTYTFPSEYAFTSAPVVLGQIQSMAGETNTVPGDVSSPWMTTVFRNTTTTGTEVALEYSGTTTALADGVTVPVGILTMRSNVSGDFNDLSANPVNFVTKNATLPVPTSIVNTPFSRTCASIDIGTSFSAAPIILGSKVSRNASADGGWLARCTSGSGNGISAINLAIEEDSVDIDRTPLAESVSLVMFSGAFNADFGAGAYTVRRIAIEHEGQAMPCYWTPVTFSMKSQAGPLVGNYAGTIDINTQTGSGRWRLAEGAGEFIEGQGGRAYYTYNESDKGVVVLELNHPVGSVYLTARDVTDTAIESDPVAPLEIVGSALLVTKDAPASNGPYRFDTTGIRAGEIFQIYLTAVNEQSGVCVPDTTNYYETTAVIDISVEYLNPQRSLVSNGVYFLDGTGNKVYLSATGVGTAATVMTSGMTVLNFGYDDVGMMRLSFTLRGENGQVLRGNTGNMVVQPYDMIVQDVYFQTDQSYVGTNVRVDQSVRTRPDLFREFQTTTAYDPAQMELSSESATMEGVFRTAGQPFEVTVVPVNAFGNRVTQYGLETPSQVIKLESEVMAPVSGYNGTDNRGVHQPDSFILEGEVWRNPSVAYGEVGYMGLRAQSKDRSYLGIPEVQHTQSAPIGRFIPDYFTVEIAQVGGVQTGCASDSLANSFTYLNQPVPFITKPKLKINPRDYNGNKIYNYQTFEGDQYNYFRMPDRLRHQDGQGRPRLELVNETTILGVTIAPDDEDDDSHIFEKSATPFARDGGIFYEYRGDWIKFTHIQSELGPAHLNISPFVGDFRLKINIADDDFVGLRSTQEISQSGFRDTDADVFAFSTVASEGGGLVYSSGKDILFGRLFPNNTSGVYNETVSVDVETQYYNGTSFVRNTRDRCTTEAAFNQDGFDFRNSSLSPNMPNLRADTTITVPAGPFQAGLKTILIDFPTSVRFNGYIDFYTAIAQAATWLKADWNTDGRAPDDILDDSPSARLELGSGNDEEDFLYWDDDF